MITRGQHDFRTLNFARLAEAKLSNYCLLSNFFAQILAVITFWSISWGIWEVSRGQLDFRTPYFARLAEAKLSNSAISSNLFAQILANYFLQSVFCETAKTWQNCSGRGGSLVSVDFRLRRELLANAIASGLQRTLPQKFHVFAKCDPTYFIEGKKLPRGGIFPYLSPALDNICIYI